jgi:LmbE family N-acetylglucosaminyl deacetylase/CheY-like chemotaxis protein
MNEIEPGGSAGRILVVEDDPEAASFLIQVLGVRGGFDVTHTADPVAALLRASSESWDLVLTDVEMPGMTGIELLESLRRVAPDLPVAVMTAHATVHNAVSALRGRADEFLQKPLHPAQLTDTVSRLVAKGRAERERKREVVLAIGAHPDDVEIGVGGTLAAHSQLGHQVAVLTLSRGSRGGLERERAEESEQAARILGAKLYLEDLEDTRISEGDPTIRIISRVIGEVQPTMIYTHSIHDVHQDHRNTHRAVMVAGRQIGRVFCFQSPSATVDFRPSKFVPVDGQLDAKLQAIEAFGSQVAVRAYLEPDLISATARYWSRFSDGRYAEAFEVIRDGASIGVSEPPGHAAGIHEDVSLPEMAAPAAMRTAVGGPDDGA